MSEETSVASFLPKGTKVEVRNRFTGTWASGFRVLEVLPQEKAYLLERISDGAQLPEPFPAEDVRRARKSASLWWARTF